MNYVVVDKATRAYKRDGNLQAQTVVGPSEDLIQVKEYPNGTAVVYETDIPRPPTPAEQAQIAARGSERPVRPDTLAILKLVAKYENLPLAQVLSDYREGV